MVDFKTSFIPKKKPSALKQREERLRGRGVGILGFISFVVFLVSLLIWGGLFFYQALLERNILDMSASIERVRQAIEPELIERLAETDLRLNTADILLDNHMIVSPVFRLLEDLTLSTVRFSSFGYSIDSEDVAKISLVGEAQDYASLALQSDIFGDARVMEQPLFENLNINERGNVSFQFSTPISSSFILYKNHLDPSTRALRVESVPQVEPTPDILEEIPLELDLELEDVSEEELGGSITQ